MALKATPALNSFLRAGVRRVPRFVFVYAGILLALVALSSPRRTGDANDYVGMAHNLSHARAPTFPGDLQDLRAYFARWGTGYENVPPFFLVPENRGDDGRYDAQHFWFYPALAAPFLIVTDALGVHPNFAFTAVNLLLLLLAAAVVARRLSWGVAALLFLGPVIWWVDKAQTEAFTFSMLAVAMAYLRERPGVSLVCLGAAATQNPPFAVVLGIAGVAAAVARPAWLREREFQLGAVVGVVLAALYPAYYLVHLGRASSLHGVHQHVPNLAELKFPLLDLNFGLVPDAPVIPLVVAGLVIAVIRRRPRRLAGFDVLVAVAAVPVFLYAFGQSPSLAAGGTASMTRYALWLIPLSIPLLARAQGPGGVSARWVYAGAAVGAVWSVAFFSPSRGSDALQRPTAWASWVWRHWPSLDNPLAEVFYQRTAHEFGSPQPTATRSCSKVLIVYGEWARCPVGRVPPRCRARPCYANRSGGRYDFADAPLPRGTVLPGPDADPASGPAVPAAPATPGGTVTLAPRAIRVGRAELPIVPNGVRGGISESRVVGHTARFSGWAGSVTHHRPAREILVFADGRFLGSAPPTVPRPDVVQALGAGLRLSGFAIKVPLHGVQSADRRFRVQLFGVEGGVASSLPFACDRPASTVQDFAC